MEHKVKRVTTQSGKVSGGFIAAGKQAGWVGAPIHRIGLLALVLFLLEGSAAAREFTLAPDKEFRTGQNGQITVKLAAEGNENALGFSLQFDPARLQLVSATVAGNLSGASLNINDTQSTAGRLGFVLAVPAGQSFPAGNVALVQLTFGALATTGVTTLQFGDQPVFREIVDATAQELAATYAAAQITVLPAASGGDTQPPSIPDLPNRSTPVGQPIQIDFTVSDPDTPVAALIVRATSSNTMLVPDSALTLGGAGTDRILTITPVARETGSTTIQVTVSDGPRTTAKSFQLAVTNAPNAFPTISPMADQGGKISTPLRIDFTVGDAETGPAGLIVAATATNPAILPPSGIALAGTNASRSIILTATNSGSTKVTVQVTDGGGLSAKTEFLLTVASNQPPVISAISDQEIAGGNAAIVHFTIADESPLETLTLSAASSVTSVVPVAGVQFGGLGGNRSATITPSRQPGVSRLTITVTDPLGAKAEAAFNVTVLPPNLPPEITAIADVTTRENVPTELINFFVADPEIPAEELVVSAQADLPGLVGAFEFAGEGFSRTLRIVPATNQIGSSVITLTVTDGVNVTRTNFVLRVTGGARKPSLSEIAPVSFSSTNQSWLVAFTVQDDDTPLDRLKLTATANNASLFPAASLELAGEGTNRTLRLTPAPKQSGEAEITLSASDESATATRKFSVTVLAAPNVPPLVGLVSPAQNAVFSAPATVTITAEATAESGVAKVAFWANEIALGELSVPPYRYVWTNVLAGNYALHAVVTDQQGATNRSSVISIQVKLPEVPNDPFASPAQLAGTNITLQVTNTFATVEAGEPLHAGKPGGRSLWWSWVAPATGTASVSTLGSGIDTLLAVYTGTTLTNLQTIASNDDDPDGGSTSRLTFPAVAGTEYRIAIDAFGGETGLIQLELRAPGPPPPLGPPLKVEVSGKNIVLSWPTNLAGFTPESSDSLLDGSWSPLAQNPVTANGQYSLKINAATGARFFRLHRQ